MEFQVETYEAAPIGGGTQAGLEEIQSYEAQALIASLGLEGQQGLLTQRDVPDDDSVTMVNPYREMTVEEQRIFLAVAPKHSALAAYNAGPIPLRVLQVAAHAAPLFKRLEVWHPETAVLDDPILVGYRADVKYSWMESIYLLARWGAHLLPLDELREQAAARLERLWAGKIDKELRGLQSLRDGLPVQVRAHLSGASVADGLALQLG